MDGRVVLVQFLREMANKIEADEIDVREWEADPNFHWEANSMAAPPFALKQGGPMALTVRYYPYPPDK